MPTNNHRRDTPGVEAEMSDSGREWPSEAGKKYPDDISKIGRIQQSGTMDDEMRHYTGDTPKQEAPPVPEDLYKQLLKDYNSTSFKRTPPTFERWLAERIIALEQDRCPVCGGRDKIGKGPTKYECEHCSDMAEMKRLEAESAALKRRLALLTDRAAVHANILRGELPLTKAQAIHIAGLPADVMERIEEANRRIKELEGKDATSIE